MRNRFLVYGLLSLFLLPAISHGMTKNDYSYFMQQASPVSFYQFNSSEFLDLNNDGTEIYLKLGTIPDDFYALSGSCYYWDFNYQTSPSYSPDSSSVIQGGGSYTGTTDHDCLLSLIYSNGEDGQNEIAEAENLSGYGKTDGFLASATVATSTTVSVEMTGAIAQSAASLYDASKNNQDAIFFMIEFFVFIIAAFLTWKGLKFMFKL